MENSEQLGLVESRETWSLYTIISPTRVYINWKEEPSKTSDETNQLLDKPARWRKRELYGAKS